MARIEPLQPPYEPAVGQQLEAMMPPGVAPIRLFRMFVRNLPMTQSMTTWGSYELNKRMSLSMRDREIVIDRTCARCDCEYEWGVHVMFFAERVDLKEDQIASLTFGGSNDACWPAERDRLLIRAVDSLHDSADLDDALWTALAGEFGASELLDIMLLCGWYHALCFAANGSRIEPEPGAPRFADVERAVERASGGVDGTLD